MVRWLNRWMPENPLFSRLFGRWLACHDCIKANVQIDLGCGSGRDSKYFLEKGYAVIPVDGSAEMCIAASEYLHIPVRQMLFSELKFKNEFDGIWACASLLHVPKTQIRDIMAKVERALKPDGVLYA